MSRCEAKSILLFSRSATPKACKGVCGDHLRVIAPGNAALFEVMSQWWRADLTGSRFESQVSHFRDEQQKRFLVKCTCTDCSRYTELRKIYRFVFEGTRIEAKAKDPKKIRGQGHGQGQPFRGQTLSRPRTGMLKAKAKDQGHRH